MGELVEMVDRVYGRKKSIRLIRPTEWTSASSREFVHTRLQNRIFRSLRHYLPFLNMDVVYDDTRLRKELGSARPAILPIESYLTGLLRLIRAKAALQETSMP